MFPAFGIECWSTSQAFQYYPKIDIQVEKSAIVGTWEQSWHGGNPHPNSSFLQKLHKAISSKNECWQQGSISHCHLAANLRYLVLNGASIEQESLVMILQGCKQLIEIDVRDCDGFDEDDAEILKLASHIPSFMCKGSFLYDPFDDYEHTQIDHNYRVYGYGCCYDYD
ncbi:hypothetical protein CK203_039304 [Vitis vinifera]|uniref:Uncharacterized protein n=1 Tax=Vitis vinifera TaxID=29760 RepID=A0A438HGI9_VITVI|nr:hypothetical protein CK203_039304 [Vitis vinifera]